MMDPRDAEAIGHAFVKQYYDLIERAPKDLHKYYHHYSVVSRPNKHHVMKTVTTIDAIKDLVASWNRGRKLEMRSVDVQTGYTGGILVLVTGCYFGKNSVQKKFAQTFFLAPQDYQGGYYVRNDVLRFVGETESVDVNCDPVPGIGSSAAKSVQNDSTPVVKKKNAKTKISKKTSVYKDTSELVEKTPSKVDPKPEGENTSTPAIDEIDQNASKRYNTRSGRKVNSMLVEDCTPKRDETTYTKNQSDVPLQDPNVKNKTASGLKDKSMVSQVLDFSNMQTDLDDGSRLAHKPLLEKDMDSVQNNASAVVTDLGGSSLLVENQPLETNAVVESPINAASAVKKKKTKKESAVVSDCSNADGEVKEGSVLVENPSDLLLVENPPLLNDTSIETEQLIAVKHKKKKKEKRKKGNLVALADSNVAIELKESMALVDNSEAFEQTDIQTDVQNGPLLAEDPTLERISNVEIEKCDAVKEVKKKRKRKKENVVASEDCNVDTEVADDLVADSVVKTLQETETSVRKRKKKAKKEINIENVDTGLKVGPLLDDPHLNKDMNVKVEVENAQKDTTADVDEKMKDNVNASICGNVATNAQEDGSPLVENSPLKLDIESGQEDGTLQVLEESRDTAVDPHPNRDVHVENADMTVSVEEKVQESLNASKCGNNSTGVLNGGSSLRDCSALEGDMESVRESAELEVKETKKRKKAEILVENVDVDLKEGALLNESPRLDGDVHVENELAIASLEVKKRPKREKKKKQKPLEVGSVRTDVKEEILLVENISLVPQYLTVGNKEELVCDKPKKKKKDKITGADETEQAPGSSLPVDTVGDEIAVQDVFCVERSHGDLSNCDHQLKHLEPNMLIGNMEENKPSESSPYIEDVTALDIDNSRDLTQLSDSSPERSLPKPKKKLIILDVNGLLADIVLNPSHGYKPNLIISGKQVFKRPFCDTFLQFLLDKFDVGVWSSRVKKNVDRVISFLMGNKMNRLLFCWDQSHCTHTGVKTVENNEKPLVLKELRKLWEKQEPGLPWEKGHYNESNTLLLDDSPYKALRNPPHTAIFPESYRHENLLDTSLGPGGDLRVYLEGLARADNVQEYVKQNPFGQKPITETDLSWEFYSTIIGGDSQKQLVSQIESSFTSTSPTVNS